MIDWAAVVCPQWQLRRLEDGCLRCSLFVYVATTTAARYFVLCNSYMCVYMACMFINALGLMSWMTRIRQAYVL